MKRPLLLPLVPLYAAGLAMREMRLERGWEQVRRLRWPVISVGNLSTGGSGKTPLVIALARLLKARGFRADVLSRGYGRRSAGPARVDLNGSAEEFGDEPLLIAREAGVPVYVAAERYEAGQLAEAELSLTGAKAPFSSGGFSARLKSCPDTDLTAPGSSTRLESCPDTDLTAPGSSTRLESCPDTEPTAPGFSTRLESCVDTNPTAPGEPTNPPPFRGLHILDDGFQHRQLARDVDVLMVNREDWHDHLLPAGNLRESAQAARRATVLAIPAEDAGFESELRAWGWNGPVWRVRRRMEVPRLDGPVAAFCGIARPEQFFAGLEAAGLRLAVKKAFRDHYDYTEQVVDWLGGQARSAGAAALITTEKDAVRLQRLMSRLPAELPLRTAGLRVEFVEEDAVLDWIVARVDGTGMRTAL